MSFLYPQFLWGLLALAIPIIIHLFNFRRTKTVMFSSTRFLRQVKEKSKSKLKIKHYLILASRLLFIFFLVMAFAQPIQRSKDATPLSENVILYLDNSQSMTNEVDEDLTALDAAILNAGAILRQLPEGTRYKLLTNEFDPFSSGYHSKSEIEEQLTLISYSGIQRNNDDISRRLDGEKEKNPSVFWLSDFQRISNDADVTIDSNLTVNLVPLNFTAERNLAVDSVYLENPFVLGNEKARLNVVLRNYGDQPVFNQVVKVYMNNQQVATGNVDIQPATTSILTFDLAFGLDGVNKGMISFEEFPVTFDNEFYFTLDITSKVNVLEIKNTDNRTYVTEVYGNNQLFELNSRNQANLDYQQINSADLVILNELPFLEASLRLNLNRFIQSGGDIMIIPSNQIDISSYSGLFGLPSMTRADSVQMVNLQAPDLNNPFFNNVFQENNQRIAMPRASQVLNWGVDRAALLSYVNGTPFLSARGAFYLLSAPLNDAYSTFQEHALFVPVMYKIAAQSGQKERKLYQDVAASVIRLRDVDLMGDQVLRLKQDEQEVIPAQRQVGEDVLIEVPKNTLQSGFYDVLLEKEFITSFAFNYPFSESNPDQLIKDEIENYFHGNILFFDAKLPDEFAAQLKSEYIGTELWKAAIILSLLFLLAEVLLIRFFP